MKNIKNITFIALATFILSCCGDKDPATLITGTVVEYGSAAPIPNAQVYVIAGKSNGAFKPRTEWFIDTVRTDNDGKFKLTPNDADAEYYNITSIKKDNFYNINDPLFCFPNKKEDFEIELDPYAWLEIEAIDVDSIEGGYLLFHGSYVKEQVPLNGFFSIVEQISGNRYIYLYIKTINYPPVFKDSIYIAAQDTGFYQILY